VPGRQCDDQLAVLDKELVRRQQQTPIGLARQRINRALDLGDAIDRSGINKIRTSRAMARAEA